MHLWEKTKMIRLIFILLFFTLIQVRAQTDFPGKFWKAYQDPEQAGFSTDKLQKVLDQFHQSKGAVLLIIHDGKILLADGPLHRRFRQASIRKSYLSALYGAAVHEGDIDTTQTLKALRQDDIQGLSSDELQATVWDLLRSRSGVYHPSSYSLNSNFPARGSKKPGTYWWYNNWDFNMLGTIYNQKVNDLFRDFKEKIAKPIRMQNFEISHGFYRYELDKSQHPAYLFRLTALDMARFGLLYLNEGSWKKSQIITAGWVQNSTQAHSTNLGTNFNSRIGYGLMWWTNSIEGETYYFASGAGGQRIFIIPQSKLVVVHLTDTYQNNNVQESQLNKLLELILESRVGTASTHPTLSKFKTSAPRLANTAIAKDLIGSVTGVYKHPHFGQLKVESQKRRLNLTTPIGIFPLYKLDHTTFYNPDLDQKIRLVKAGPDHEKFTISPLVNESGEVYTLVFYF